MYARTNGYVSQRFADIGDRVKAGQILAHLDTPEVDQSAIEAQSQVLANIAGKVQSEANLEKAQAELERAIADLAQSKANLTERESDQKFSFSTYLRWKSLGVDGAVSQQDVDERDTKNKANIALKDAAIARVRAAESEVHAARARLRAERASLSASEANILAAKAHAGRSTSEKSFQNVVSPFTGVITERSVETGMLISSGSDTSKTPLYKVARIDEVKIFVDVPQYAARAISVGQSIEVNLKEFPGKMFRGNIARTSVALDPASRTLRTEIHISNSRLELSPGMYADVTLNVRRANNTLLIPANALVNRADGPQVVVVTDNKVHYRQVKLGDDLGKEIEVVSGLLPTDALVINPPDSIKEGSPVHAL